MSASSQAITAFSEKGFRLVRPREDDKGHREIVDEGEEVLDDEETDDEDGSGPGAAKKENGSGKISLNNLKDMQQEVVNWLRDNYEVDEEISLARDTIFAHYIDFCHARGLDKMGTASFGKMVRLVFPEVKTRRLGVRGQSRYHYQGVRVKTSSLLSPRDNQQRAVVPQPKRYPPSHLTLAPFFMTHGRKMGNLG